MFKEIKLINLNICGICKVISIFKSIVYNNFNILCLYIEKCIDDIEK